DLPEPFGPSSATNSPRGTSRFSPRRTGLTPKILVRSRTSIVGRVGAAASAIVVVQERDQALFQHFAALGIRLVVDRALGVGVVQLGQRAEQVLLRRVATGRLPACDRDRRGGPALAPPHDP